MFSNRSGVRGSKGDKEGFWSRENPTMLVSYCSKPGVCWIFNPNALQNRGKSDLNSLFLNIKIYRSFLLRCREIIMHGLAFWHNTLDLDLSICCCQAEIRPLRAPSAVGWEPFSRIPLESCILIGNICHSMLQVTLQSTADELREPFPAPQLLVSARSEALESFPLLLCDIHVHGREQHVPEIGKSACKAFGRGSGELQSCPGNYF